MSGNKGKDQKLETSICAHTDKGPLFHGSFISSVLVIHFFAEMI